MAQILFSPRSRHSPWYTIVRRLLLLVGLYLFIFAVFLWDRDGLRDSTKPPGEQVGILDLLYFTAVTVTTVGYGDIVPVSPLARGIDIVLVTPARMIAWLLFVGTTVELTFTRFKEDYAMSKLKGRLSRHVILCGYGMTGRAVAHELAALGTDSAQIVIIDPDEGECQAASDEGFTALRGDATREAVLEMADIRDAAHVIAATGRDDTNVLVCLTARSMNPKARIAASVSQEENLKLLRASGAVTTVMPSAAGGRILAASTRNDAIADLLEDLLTTGGSVRLARREASKTEVGTPAAAIGDGIVIGLERGGRRLSVRELRGATVEAGDVLVLLVDVPRTVATA